jgi:hypothetical protein
MRVLRALSGAILWILATVLGLVSVILCVTVVLLPIGFPLLLLAGRLFGRAVRLFMPPEAAHPFKESKKSAEKAAGNAKDGLKSLDGFDTGKARKRLNKTWQKLTHA